MKVLIVHTKYKQKGGEDMVVAAETALLRSKDIIVENLEFTNEGKTLLKFFQLPFNVGSFFTAKRALKHYQPDIVHIHNLHFAASVSVLYAVKKRKIPCVFTVHNYRLLCPSATLFNKQKPFLQSLHGGFPWAAVSNAVYNNSKILTFWMGLTMWLNNLAGSWQLIDKFIVLTDQSRAILQESHLKLSPEKIVVKPNFVSDNTVDQPVREEHFLYVGRLSAEKGIDLLLSAFEKSRHTLKIIGDGPLREKVEAHCNRYRNITYLGLQDKQTIAFEMRSCTALIFPSLWHETFGLTIIEAYAASTPVIASNIGAASMLIQNEITGLHFEPSNVTDLKNKLDTWFALAEFEKEMYRLNARKSFELHFTGEKNYEQLLSIYNSVLGKKKIA